MAEAGNTLQPAPVFEILERALAGEPLDGRDAMRLIECSDAELPSVMRAAAEMRDQRQRPRGHLFAQGFPASYQSLSRSLHLLYLSQGPERSRGLDDDVGGNRAMVASAGAKWVARKP